MLAVVLCCCVRRLVAPPRQHDDVETESDSAWCVVETVSGAALETVLLVVYQRAC